MQFLGRMYNAGECPTLNLGIECGMASTKTAPGSVVAEYFKKLGPGLITGAADDDPSGISTYSVAGATTGLSTLWLALITTPMMAVIQGMCARIGMVTGLGLAATIRKTCPLWLAYALAAIVVIANTINIGADIAGMAGSASLVLHLPPVVWIFVFGLGLIFGQVFLSYRAIASVIKYLTLSLFAYVVTAFIVRPVSKASRRARERRGPAPGRRRRPCSRRDRRSRRLPDWARRRKRPSGRSRRSPRISSLMALVCLRKTRYPLTPRWSPTRERRSDPAERRHDCVPKIGMNNETFSGRYSR